MTRFSVTILERNYSKYIIKNIDSGIDEVIESKLTFDPLEQKLFDQDIFSYENNRLHIIHSPIITNNNIPAILILENNKTYGRNVIPGKTYTLKNQAKLLYKCIPNDPHIPVFLVAYEIKTLGFSKVQSNLYVTIQFTQWTDKHPQATISQIIGSVDELSHFYEYQLYCKNLNHSITQFNKQTLHNLKDITDKKQFIKQICDKHNTIEDRTKWHTFSIDPQGSLDFDDAFSIKKIDNNRHMVSIYIANVAIWLDELKLWSAFSNRVSTIYLPDKKRPMLPNILSDCLCSLQANEERFAFTIDIIVENDLYQATIIDIKYSNTLIKIHKNYVYEECDLLGNTNYTLLLDITRKLSNKYKYINTIHDSHELVAYLMILMNHFCATSLLKSNKGIFRSTIAKENRIVLPDNLPDEVNTFMRMWNSSSGTYIDIEQINGVVNIRHETLDLDSYIHITSPIRRIVDLLNIIQFQHSLNLITLSQDATTFLNKWTSAIEYINNNMKSIKKVQNDCNLLHAVSNNPAIIDKVYDGYCFDKIVTQEGLFKYNVYLPELKLNSIIVMGNDFDNYVKKSFKLFIFNNEEKFKKKIRLSLIQN